MHCYFPPLYLLMDASPLNHIKWVLCIMYVFNVLTFHIKSHLHMIIEDLNNSQLFDIISVDI